MRSLGSCEIQLENVFVSDEDVLGEPGNGWRLLAETLNSERIMNGANCSGALQGILDDSVKYASERVAVGKQIGQFQAVQPMIAVESRDFEPSKPSHTSATTGGAMRPVG